MFVPVLILLTWFTELHSSGKHRLGDVVTRSTPLAPMMGPDAVSASAAVRSPKTAELVAGTLRRMVVDGQLKDGDFLPNEAELMAHFGVSRPTLREAVRVLESERLVEVRRGSRTGARVRVPGPEIVARPAGLLLELSGATIADVMVARAGIEPMAARLLAESGRPEAFDELEKMVAEYIPAGWQSDRLAQTTGDFHRRMVELSGNATLAIIAGMLHEITVRHTAFVFKEGRPVSKADYDKLMRSYGRLMRLLRSGDGAAAEAHWRKHLDVARELSLQGLEDVKVRDVMG
jgi:GntR family transcriptional regulator, transcriptional repressor for pyruvate dehydrogenase complex